LELHVSSFENILGVSIFGRAFSIFTCCARIGDELMARFSDIITDIVQKKQTGLLTAVPVSGKHHLKIFFSGGEIYYLNYGDARDADCLAACQQLEWADCSFASGVKVAAAEKCPLPTGRIIVELRKCFDKAPAGGSDFSVICEKLKVALVRQIGPIGNLVFTGVLDQWQASSPPTREQVAGLVALLRGKIEDEKSREAFTNEANTIIS
jgi:hypothetical protein